MPTSKLPTPICASMNSIPIERTRQMIAVDILEVPVSRNNKCYLIRLHHKVGRSHLTSKWNSCLHHRGAGGTVCYVWHTSDSLCIQTREGHLRVQFCNKHYLRCLEWSRPTLHLTILKVMGWWSYLIDPCYNFWEENSTSLWYRTHQHSSTGCNPLHCCLAGHWSFHPLEHLKHLIILQGTVEANLVEAVTRQKGSYDIKGIKMLDLFGYLSQQLNPKWCMYSLILLHCSEHFWPFLLSLCACNYVT